MGRRTANSALDGIRADFHEAQQRRSALVALHWVPSHKNGEQAVSMGLRWWHVVANQAADESAMEFGLTCQLDGGALRHAAEVEDIARLVQERLVAIDGEVMATQGKLTKLARVAAQRATAAERAKNGAENRSAESRGRRPRWGASFA